MSMAIASNFQWPLGKLTIEDAHKLGLVKGVLQVEGETLRNETYSRDDIAAGAGGLRVSAQMNQAYISVDHIHNELPKIYQDKYGAPAGGYPPAGFLLDVQYVENAEGKMQIEGIMALDQWLYNAVKDGYAKGNSTELMVRKKENCGPDGKGCEYEGHAFIRNTIALEGTPNGEGTWVEPVTEADIGTILKDDAVENSISKMPVWERVNNILAPKEVVENELAEYMIDNKWKDVEAVKSYLTDIKNLEGDIVDGLAAHIIENPNEFSHDQYLNMTGSQFSTWWQHGPHAKAKLEAEKAKVENENEELKKELKEEKAVPQTEAPETEKVKAEPEKPEVKAEAEKEEEKEPECGCKKEEELVANTEPPSHSEPAASVDDKPDNTQRKNEIMFVLNELRPLTTRIPIRAGDTKLYGILRHIDERCKDLEAELARL